MVITRDLQRFLSVVFYAIWVVGIVIVALTAAALPYDPSATWPVDHHTQNSPATIAIVVIVSLLEIVALTSFLRPWQDTDLARRAFRSFVLLGFWAGVWGGYAIGTGPVVGLHAAHLLLQWCLLGIFAVNAWLAARSRRPTSRPDAA